MEQRKRLTWGSLLPTNSPVILLCTATTGLKPPEGKCIGVWYRIFDVRSQISTQDCLIRDLSEEELAQGSEYHKITSEFVRVHALDKEAFRRRCVELFGSATLLTFNPKFQSQWLPEAVGHLFDLPLLLKGADMRICMTPEDSGSLRNAEAFFMTMTFSPKIQESMRWHGVTEAEAEFPVESKLVGLFHLFRAWKNLELSVQEPTT
jgi:hypothetical protein